ncbi:hypothetical protein WN944_014716 [Citrus x changshan-huyou]|uniref:Uncharacterized protein n=1 Tax=Citrus x changshan-huyou TaxID=2935761 RepID=A0AAP0MB35_9ROSI
MQSGGNIERLCHQRSVNIVDHLGSVTCKVNDPLDAKVDEVSDAEHRVSCMNSLGKYIGSLESSGNMRKRNNTSVQSFANIMTIHLNIYA